jgi:hypothetical protein
VFGTAGDAAPTLGGRWTYREDSLNDPAVADELAGYGIQVRGPGELPFVDLP